MKYLFRRNFLWAAGIMVFLSTVLAKHADDERSIHILAAQHRLCPVLITKVTVGGLSVQAGLLDGSPRNFEPVVPFKASGAWLPNVAVRLINRTDRVIVAGVLDVVFRDTGDCSRVAPCLNYPIQFGKIPEGVEKATDATFGSGTPMAWKPNESIDIHFSDYISGLQGQLENQMPMENVSKIDLHTGPFYFADGMRWGAGADFAVPQPGNPGRFANLDRSFFPGNKLLNWPPARSGTIPVSDSH